MFRKLRNSLHTHHIINEDTAFELKVYGTEFVAKKGEGATCNLRQLLVLMKCSLAALLKVQKNNLTEMIILTCMQKEVDKKANKAPNRTNIKLEHTSKTPIVSFETINDILIMILYHQ